MFFKFSNNIKNLRKKLTKLTTNNENYTSVLIPGSGTYAIESVLSSVINKENTLGLLINGSYGKRMLDIANIHNIKTECIYLPENKSFNVDHLKNFSENVSHIAIVHCETTTGILNNIETFKDYFNNNNKTFIVDAMSSFGGVPIDIKKNNIDYLISSSNKCLHGPPGLSFCIANKSKLLNLNNKPKTLSLDLKEQFNYLEKNNQFRFTPPTHIINALYQSILELDNCGGVFERNNQYKKYNKLIMDNLLDLNFNNYELENNSNIISTWYYPDNFDFNHFYNYLENKNVIIYPGKLSNENVFRIGNIGNLKINDIEYFISLIKKYKLNYL